MANPGYEARGNTLVSPYQSILERTNTLRLPGAIPLIAISGSRGKSTVACMLAAIMRSANRSSGAWMSSGVFAYNERLEGELGPWQKVLLAARHGELDLAIQEMNASTVVAVGLPAATYPMAVFTTICGNNEACLLSPDTRTERQALDRVLRSVRTDGLIVAGADDFDVAEAVESTEISRVLFALRKENPVLERHLRSGGVGAWIDGDEICVGRFDQYERVVRVEDIPATLGGTLVFQMQNALAAVLAARSMDVSPVAIARALSSFAPDPGIQPAACNIIAYNGARVIVDAPHQIWSLRMLMRGIRNLPRRRTMVVSGVFPALPLEDVAEAGRLLGTLGAIVVLHADSDSGERLEAVRTGISTAPVLPLVILAQDELQAIDTMLNKIGPEDVALVLASDPGRALEHLWPAPAISIQPPSKANGAHR